MTTSSAAYIFSRYSSYLKCSERDPKNKFMRSLKMASQQFVAFIGCDAPSVPAFNPERSHIAPGMRVVIIDEWMREIEKYASSLAYVWGLKNFEGKKKFKRYETATVLRVGLYLPLHKKRPICLVAIETDRGGQYLFFIRGLALIPDENGRESEEFSFPIPKIDPLDGIFKENDVRRAYFDHIKEVLTPGTEIEFVDPHYGSYGQQLVDLYPELGIKIKDDFESWTFDKIYEKYGTVLGVVNTLNSDVVVGIRTYKGVHCIYNCDSIKMKTTS